MSNNEKPKDPTETNTSGFPGEARLVQGVIEGEYDLSTRKGCREYDMANGIYLDEGGEFCDNPEGVNFEHSKELRYLMSNPTSLNEFLVQFPEYSKEVDTYRFIIHRPTKAWYFSMRGIQIILWESVTGQKYAHRNNKTAS